MTRSEDIQNYMKLFYWDTNIPVYLYEGDRLTFCVPEQPDFCYPPEKYTEKLWEDGEKRLRQSDTSTASGSRYISYTATEYGVYFGRITLKETPDWSLVFGPVNNIPYTSADLHLMCVDFIVAGNNQENFRKFLDAIPQTSQNAFLIKLLFVNYSLNKEKGSLSEFLPVNEVRLPANNSIAEETFHQKEEFHNKSYELEDLILNLIRMGNTEGVQSLEVNDSIAHVGIVGPTSLRQIKNILIVSITLYTRAAIEGGVDYDTAYRLSDEFIQTAERIQNPEALNELLSKIPYIFAQKVYESQTPISSNDIMQKAIHFIQQHTNQHLTVDDVADYVGFSRSYFSAYFKQELGFTVSTFITRCKLEEARRLLQYTNKPLSVISNYLCFSSQSHFQNTFKKKFGVTPLQYRKDPKKS